MYIPKQKEQNTLMHASRHMHAHTNVCTHTRTQVYLILEVGTQSARVLANILGSKYRPQKASGRDSQQGR